MLQLEDNKDSCWSAFAKDQVTQNVLPFWINNVMDHEGGLYGETATDGTASKQANRGLILHARALWSFSFSYSQSKDPAYIAAAHHIYRYIIDHFWDDRFGGVFWSVDHQGEIASADKFLIAQAYALFGFAAYAKIVSDTSVRIRITDLRNIIGQRFKVAESVYRTQLDQSMMHSVLARPIIEVCPQLHVLEALLEVARCVPEQQDTAEIRYLVQWFLNRVFPVQDSMTLEFDADWKVESSELSYGHNFESSWLVYEAAEWLEDPELINQAKAELLRLVDYSMQHCRHRSGAIIYGKTSTGHDTELLSWWPQTEASNALLVAYRVTGNKDYINSLHEHWAMIEKYWVDSENGEWYTELDHTMQPAGLKLKAGMWRCSYHTVRACWRVANNYTDK